MADSTAPGLADLLGRLALQAEDGFAAQAFTGHAIGKTADSLHLAIPTGILSIPFTEIRDVTPVNAMEPDWVTVVVGNVGNTQHLRQADTASAWQNPGPASAPAAPPLGRILVTRGPDGVGSYTNICADTTTLTSREGADATDDGGCRNVNIDA